MEKISRDDPDALEEIGTKLRDLEKEYKREEIKRFLSGKYDRGNAIITIASGAGGVDSQDWVSILLRMYQKYAEKRGYEALMLHEAFGEGVGPEGPVRKNVTFEVRGKYAYGYLKHETGVHRLVRISPFSSQQLRHTSFALVEVLPEISEPKEADIEVRPEDIEVDTFRSSGPGGQNVNKRDSAVRIHHIPTGITVACQAERLQGENRERAMKLLVSKLYALKLQEEKKELSKMKKNVSPDWGAQIRSYVLHPYKLVKDVRTGVEVSDAASVLNGYLDPFIEAGVKGINHV